MIGQRIPALALLCFVTSSSFSQGHATDKVDAEIERIIIQLKHEQPAVRMEAFMAIRAKYQSRADAAVPTLIELLKASATDEGHLQVRKALAAIGPAAESALLRLLQEEDATSRERAAMALAYMSLGQRKPLSAVPALIEAARDEEKSVRLHSLGALGEIGPVSNDVVPAIVLAIEDEDATVRQAAVRALAGIGPSAKSATPLLIKLLRRNDTTSRANAIFALGRIGPDARAASGPLIQLLKDEVLQEETSIAGWITQPQSSHGVI